VQEADEDSSELDSEEEFNRVMAEEDPELGKDLEAAIQEEDGDIEMEDDQEFADDAGELNIPEDEQEVEDNEDDLKGDDTDSDLEDYYRELGIETDNKGDQYKKKSKASKKTPVEAPAISREEAR
jgi:hypothetical protein